MQVDFLIHAVYIRSVSYIFAADKGFEDLSFTDWMLMTFRLVPVTVQGRTIRGPIRIGVRRRLPERARGPETDWDQISDRWRRSFDAQDRYYREHYAEAAFQIILSDGRPVGRLYVARLPEEIRIVDIALLPEHRGMGIGFRLLRALISESEASEKPLSIYVERFNLALHLYERLGFRKAADKGVYFLMERPPGASG